MQTMYRKKLEARDVKDQARGRWLEIIQALAPGLFDEAIANLGEHVDCPLHGGKEDFRFVKRARKGRGNTAEDGVAMCSCGPYHDGFKLLERAMGLPFYEVLKEVDEYLNGPADQPMVRPALKPVVPVKSAEDEAEEARRLLEKVKNLWAAGKPLNIAEYPYYRCRGLHPRVLADIQDVRSIASLGYYHRSSETKELVKMGSFPALLALMRGADGEPVAVHRTWLSKERNDKAPVPKAKKLSQTPNAAGGAVRLFPAEGSDILGVTEGIETALAVRQLALGRYWPEMGTIPVWACYAERNIRNFQIPPELLQTLRTLVVFADNDESGTGLAAAEAFKARMAEEQPQLEVVIKLPDVAGMDWLDVLVNI